MKLDAKSEEKLKGVHPKLIEVVRRAAEIRPVKFIVTCGPRSMTEQKRLVKIGASKTLKGRHVPDNNKCKLSCAVDVAFVVGGKLRWDWPLFADVAKSFKQAARELHIPLEWGGDWKSFKDGPHFQLPTKEFP